MSRLPERRLAMRLPLHLSSFAAARLSQFQSAAIAACRVPNALE